MEATIKITMLWNIGFKDSTYFYINNKTVPELWGQFLIVCMPGLNLRPLDVDAYISSTVAQ
jgi:hypothetical protein